MNNLHTAAIYDLSWSDRDDFMITGSMDQNIGVVDTSFLKTDNRLDGLLLSGNKGIVRSVNLSLDSNLAVSGGKDPNLRIWDCKTFNLKQTMPISIPYVKHQ